jgi:hypothetical protein
LPNKLYYYFHYKKQKKTKRVTGKLKWDPRRSLCQQWPGPLPAVSLPPQWHRPTQRATLPWLPISPLRHSVPQLLQETSCSHDPVVALCFIYLFFVVETGYRFVAQACLELTILLPQSPEYWDYRCVPPHL